MQKTVFCILLVLAALAAGCSTENTAGSPDRPDHSPTGITGGRAIAIAVDTGDISTFSPEAKEEFIRGLSASTRYARYNEALRYFDAALALDRNFTEAYSAKGVALHNLKRYDEAVTSYDEALALDPQNAAGWSLKGAALEDAGLQADAAECYRVAAAIDPRYGVGQR